MTRCVLYLSAPIKMQRMIEDLFRFTVLLQQTHTHTHIWGHMSLWGPFIHLLSLLNGTCEPKCRVFRLFHKSARYYPSIYSEGSVEGLLELVRTQISRFSLLSSNPSFLSVGEASAADREQNRFCNDMFTAPSTGTASPETVCRR